MKLAIGGDCYPFVRDPESYEYFANPQTVDDADKVKAFQKLGEKAIIFILAAVVLGLQSLHALNVIYRDLKPQNILIFEDGYPKLADFGVAAKYDDDDDIYFQMKGTILYFAPQIIRKRGYDRSIDFWALGVLAYELTYKQPPFSSSYINSKVFEKKINQRIQNNLWPSFKGSKAMRDFINRLLVIDPKKRLGYASFRQIKQHSLFSSINWLQFENRKIVSPLIKIISMYPLVIKTQAQINQIIDQQDHGYIPFTFVRHTTDTDRKTVEIIPMTFAIDKNMNLNWIKKKNRQEEQTE